ncbi:MAG: YggS family pyridoxal phosphate-dependent enzyme [Firmicutes bacterium]|nr:YggS family pyridoxal phosphate-dependent enzyme [Candidatus Fiminaster equi]
MIRKDIKDFLKTIPSDVTLVAATKYVDVDDMNELFRMGITNFGENRTESFLRKYSLLNNREITWHFIGHLQRNKALDVINKIDFLHSLDSLKLAKVIEDHCTHKLKCFIEVSINLEENKNGVPYYEVENFVKELQKFSKIELVGFMMMAIKASDEESLDSQFKKLRELRDKIEKKLNIKIPYLSMGMSDDYKSALNEGATHIRLGRILYN